MATEFFSQLLSKHIFLSIREIVFDFVKCLKIFEKEKGRKDFFCSMFSVVEEIFLLVNGLAVIRFRCGVGGTRYKSDRVARSVASLIKDPPRT